MAGRKGTSADESGERQIKPSGSVFFVDRTIYRIITRNRASNIVYLYNIIEDKNQTMLLSDFKKHSKRAYSVSNTARILEVKKQSLYRYIEQGLINPPIGAAINGERKFRQYSYFSEDDLFKIRNVMASIHRGRPRADGIVTNNKVLTEQQLRAKMGDALTLYTKTKDGRFVPVWAEETY